MSLSSTTNRVSYVGDGSSASFSFPYYFFNQSDLKVYLYDTTTGSSHLQTLNTNYTISGTANQYGLYSSGANVVMASALVSTVYVVITRDPSAVQNFVLQQNGLIPSASLTQQLDYLTLLTQRTIDRLNRTVILPDGFGGSFDPSLPSGLSTFAGQALAVNSSGTGWTFGDFGASYEPNQLIYSPSGSSLASLGGGPAGYVLQANGSSAPTWAAVSLSGSSVSGTLSLANGGTGGLTPQRWGVVFASSATELATTDPAPVGLPLVSNASSAPTFQQVNFATVGSGFVPIANGGTGAGTAAAAFKALSPMSTTGDIIIYGSNSQQVSLAAGAAGLFLTSNGPGTQPTWQAQVYGSSSLRVVNNLSDVANAATAIKNISPMTSFGDIMYAGSALTVTALAAGVSGQVLQTNGAGAAPSWVTPSVAGSTAPLSVLTKTASYNAAPGDDLILCNSSAMTINLYGVSGNTGRIITIQKIDNSLGVVTIAGSNANINGSATTTLNTRYEAIRLVTDGSQWTILERRCSTPPVSYTPSLISGWGSTAAVQAYSWREGNLLKGRMSFTCGTVSGTVAEVSIGFNGTDQNVFVDSSLITTSYTARAVGTYNSNATNCANPCFIKPGSSLTKLYFLSVGGNSVTAANANQVAANNAEFSCEYTIPIAGWKN